MFLSRKSKGVFNSNLKPLYITFLHSIKSSKYRIGIRFDIGRLAVKQNNCLTKILNIYMVYYLDARPRIPTNNLKFKDLLFRATSLVKSSGKEKYVYIRYRITFDSVGWSSFDNETARNVIVFGVDKSSSSNSDNRKTIF